MRKKISLVTHVGTRKTILHMQEDNFFHYYTCRLSLVPHVVSSVVDPGPYVPVPPGSGSVIISTDPDPSIIKQK
jgi:hypothetical protein